MPIPTDHPAIDLLDMDFQILPVNGKVPAVPGPGGSTAATDDLGTIEQWAGRYKNCNWGIATGHEYRDGYLYVIDVDGPEGIASMKKLVAELGEIPATRKVKTGGGGYHIYLLTPEPIKGRTSGLASKVDTRGTGQYVVAPPGIHHRTGAQYEWIDESHIIDAPAAWLKAIRAQWEGRGPKHEAPSADTVVIEGGRNEWLASQLGRIIRMGYSVDDARPMLFALNKKRCKPPLDEAEIEKTMLRSSEQWDGDEPAEEVARVVNTLEASIKDDPGSAYDNIAAIASAHKNDAKQWARIKAIFRKHAMVTDVMAAIKKYEQSQLPAAKPSVDIDGEPLTQIVPGDWRRRDEGVYLVGSEGAEERILSVPLYLSKRMFTVDTNEEHVELSWFRDGGWQKTTCIRSVIASSQKIVSLSEQGLPVDSNCASQVIRYLSEVDAANDIRPEVCTTHAGWIGGDMFLPGAENNVVFTPDSRSMTHAFNCKGDPDEWRDHMRPLLDNNPLLRLHVASSFASPLLKPLNARSFIVHIWGRSAGGKTAALKAAASVWGSPDPLTINFNGTVLGMQNHAAMMGGLPLCINERQSGNKYIDKFLYSLAEGKGRLQGARSGGNRETPMWKTIICTNGEEPVTRGVGMQGTKTRVLEIEGTPFRTERDAFDLYEMFYENYGHAGPLFVSRMLEDKDWKKKLRDMYDAARAYMNDHPDKDYISSHADYMAVIAVADHLSRRWVFDDASSTLEDSLKWAFKVLDEGAETMQDQSASARGLEFFQNLYKKNAAHHFGIATTAPDGKEEISPPMRDEWGHIDNGWLWILTSEAHRLCDMEAMSARSVVSAMADEGLAGRFKNGRHSKLSKRKGNATYFVVRISMSDMAESMSDLADMAAENNG